MAREQVALDRGRRGVVAHGGVAEAQVQLLGDGEVVERAGRVQVVRDGLAQRGQAGDRGDPQVAPGRVVVAHGDEHVAQAHPRRAHPAPGSPPGRPPTGRGRRTAAAPPRRPARRSRPRSTSERVPRRIERVGRQRRRVPTEGVHEQAVGRRGGDGPVEPRAGRVDEGLQVGHVASASRVGERVRRRLVAERRPAAAARPRGTRCGRRSAASARPRTSGPGGPPAASRRRRGGSARSRRWSATGCRAPGRAARGPPRGRRCRSGGSPGGPATSSRR